MMTREMICRGCPGKLNGDCYGCRENPDNDDDDRDVEEEEEEEEDEMTETVAAAQAALTRKDSNAEADAVATLMQMLNKTNDARETAALRLACRAIVCGWLIPDAAAKKEVRHA